jgi:Ca-activated chloride channel family protein
MTRVAAIVTLAAALWPFGGKAHRETAEGNARYAAGELDDALRAYTEAQVAAPDAPQLHYDLGNVLFRKGDFAGAADAYRRALAASSPELRPQVSYNLGNALFRQEQYGEAVEAYTRTLEAVPGDADAKRNLELALRALARQEQPQPQPQPRPQGAQGEPQPQPGPSPAPPPPSGDRSGERSGERMSREEAERLLQGVAEQERDTLRHEAARRVPQRRTTTEKDW